MKLCRWRSGRRGTGYRKLTLVERESFDVHILDYPPGMYIATHTDQIPNKRHYRFNVVLRGTQDAFYAFWRGIDARKHPDAPLKQFWRFVAFRPDLVPHGVDQSKTRRVVLSVGVAI